MRTSILLIALTGFLAFSPANAGPDNGKRQDNGRGAYMKAAATNHCSDLVGTTRGLHGLCMAYCAQTDLSKVDLNDPATLRAAGPDIEILRKYNERKRPTDPDMPCHKNNDDDDGTPPDDDDGTPPDDGGGTEPPAASNCACWTGDELAAIDGVLPSGGLGTPAMECTDETDVVDLPPTTTMNQVAEGYRILGGHVSAEAWAYGVVDDDPIKPFYGCMYHRSGTEDVLRSIERADALGCMDEIVAHCTDLGQ